ncbi:pilin [Kutzneria sp. NPDC051319]|uniref:pilin n=1 Tax=Kutzneria sp. NPDC051319 TaxID=3155047 RepID=UPI003428D179
MNHQHRHGWPRAAAIAGAVVVGLVAVVARAAAETTTVIAAAGSIKDVLGAIQVWLTGLLVALATLMFTYGAVRYLAAGGDPGEAEKGKQALRNAGKGYLLALLAPIIVQILGSFVGG